MSPPAAGRRKAAPADKRKPSAAGGKAAPGPSKRASRKRRPAAAAASNAASPPAAVASTAGSADAGETHAPTFAELEPQRITLHGNSIAYRQAGSGPALVLIHGITSSSATWGRVMPYLARKFTVLAPDLLGHGESDKPKGDYSLGAHASGVRDLMVALGHEHATIVGHSLGGGIAMQFSYQFPERCERLVLVDSGGLGRDVSPLLRAATLPGSEFVLPLLAATRLLDAGAFTGRLLTRLGLRARTDLEEMARGHATLSDAGARSAFIYTLRSVVDPGGQRIAATNRLYLAKHIPFLLIWGQRDGIIPVSHGRDTHALVPDSRLEVFPESGHFPQLDEPQRFVDVLVDFLESTEPALADAAGWRELLAEG